MMERLELIRTLNDFLLAEMPSYQPYAAGFPSDSQSQRRLLRSLMNVRPPLPLEDAYLELQDRLLATEREEKGVVDGMALPVSKHPRIVLWQGDITRLFVDAIVDADNSALLGCFYPCHGCVDNAIHSAAGLQLRDECSRIMQAQGHEEPVGRAKITGGYNLPSRYVLHTVGPMVYASLTEVECGQLASCYRACLELAVEYGLRSLAFCCISTGEYHFPNQAAAEIAVETVNSFLVGDTVLERVIFDVFTEEDLAIYQELLQNGG